MTVEPYFNGFVDHDSTGSTDYVLFDRSQVTVGRLGVQTGTLDWKVLDCFVHWNYYRNLSIVISSDLLRKPDMLL